MIETMDWTVFLLAYGTVVGLVWYIFYRGGPRNGV